MTKTLQLLRGTTAQNNAFTGHVGELTVDTTTNELRLHDGSTAGGHVLAKKADKANVSLDNLTSTGKNIGNWSTNVTNCITNIPQDIKLELNTTTHSVILKAGSKVYVPNGGVYDELVIASDLTLGPIGNYTGSSLLYVLSDGSVLNQSVDNTSGTTAPAGNGNWWDTTANKIKQYVSGSWNNNILSVPIAKIHRTGGNWDSIEIIFNGVGYMGSTLFEITGHEGLAPNGKNADGSYKNISIVSNTVRTVTLGSTTGKRLMAITNAGIFGISLDSWHYNEDTNYFERLSDGTKSYHYISASFYLTNGVIADFVPKQVLSNNYTNQAMPSDKYIDIATSLPASGTVYAAPADGYFVFVMNLAVNTYFAIFSNASTDVADLLDIQNSALAQNYVIRVPIARGGIIRIQYGGTPTLRTARFYYAQGSI